MARSRTAGNGTLILGGGLAGAYVARLLGRRGVREWRTDVVALIVSELGLENVMFEAAEPDVFSWYAKNDGADVNLFVDHSQIVQLECLRYSLSRKNLGSDSWLYPMPSMNFASSDILSGVQGGSQVSSISTSSTPGSEDTTFWMSPWIIGPAGQPIEVRLWITFTLAPSTSTSYRSPISTMSIPSSGSSTPRRASIASSRVGMKPSLPAEGVRSVRHGAGRARRGVRSPAPPPAHRTPWWTVE